MLRRPATTIVLTSKDITQAKDKLQNQNMKTNTGDQTFFEIDKLPVKKP